MMKVTERRDGSQHTPVRFLEKKQILVVNEPRTTNMVRMSLELEGYEVLEANTGTEALNYIYERQPDLVILDIQLPDDNGLRIVRQLREHSNLPVIILTEQDSEADKTYALHVGADDYMTKPFSMRELTSRAKSILRRAKWTHTSPTSTIVKVDDRLQVDFNRNEVIVAGERIRLRPTERRLLHLLMENAGWTVPHTKLLRFVWGCEEMAFAHYVRLYVNYLRAKIEEDPAIPYYILSERGYGYRFIDFKGGEN